MQPLSTDVKTVLKAMKIYYGQLSDKIFRKKLTSFDSVITTKTVQLRLL